MSNSRKPTKPWLAYIPAKDQRHGGHQFRKMNRRRYKAIRRRNWWRLINTKRVLDGNPEIVLNETVLK